MRDFFRLVIVALLTVPTLLFGAQVVEGPAAERIIPGAERVRTSDKSDIPSFIRFKKDQQPTFAHFDELAKQMLRLNSDDGFILLNSDKDPLGFTHYRYQQTFKGFPVEGSMWIVHVKNGKIVSMNGDYFSGIHAPCLTSITESQALVKAMDHVGASVFKWQLPEEEAFLKWEQQDPAATFFPSAKMTLTPVGGDFHSPKYKFAYNFNIYAHTPLSRQEVHIDARTGDVLWTKNLIHHADSNGTANTGYSGTVAITADFTGTNFRLRESGRGNGIQTFDMNEGTAYGAAVDFTDNDNFWNNPANLDQYAGDAHWGAEQTYDYFLIKHGRNSINNSGFTLRSYVHYDNAYGNAFWDGSRMTYGDGNNRPFTAIDIAGHEIAHGLTTFTANLVYQDESGALNESFSDIFGTAIENYGRPLAWSWRIGEDLFSGGFRNMQNPGNFGDPDTYFGTNWYTGTGDNGGVHTNSGVQNKWFYILTQGETGTNDIGDSYSVTGIGMDKAAGIAFRNLTVYLSPSSDYADARFYAIESALDLYGACSNEVTQTTNAWYAVGIGTEFNPNGVADFVADAPTTCTGTVYFTDQSTATANGWVWDFGDGTSDTVANPSHTYGANGTYSVSLIISKCNGLDTVVKSSYITVARPNGPTAANVGRCGPGTVTLNASGTGNLKWYDAPTGGTQIATGTSYTTPNISTTTTYYVETTVAQPSSYVGPATNSAVSSNGGYHNNTSTQYLIFDVFVPTTLKSVWVNAPASGNRTITLWDGAGTVLWDTTINIPAGTGRITLNKFLPVGDYRIGGTQMNLYRNNAGPSYPYTLAGKVSINGSSAGADYYYYLYDWELSEPPCKSLRTPVNAEINYASANITPSGPTTVCMGSSVTLTADPNSTYAWSGGASTQSITVNSSGTYSVTVTDVNGCTDSSTPITVTVTNSPMPTVSVAGNTAICPGDSVYLSASTGSSYLWSTGATTPTIPVGTAGSYTVTVTYPGGCTGTSSPTTITVNTPPTAAISSSQGTTFCDNETTTLAGSGGTSYAWSNGGTSASITASAAGSYTVTVTDANGCSDTETITLSHIPAPTASISTASTTICDGDAATLVAAGGDTYLWSDGSTTSSISVTTGGVYSVTATSANGCSDVESVSISVVTPPVADFTFSSSLLSVSFSNASTGTSGFCSYLWDFGDGSSSGSQFPTHNYSSPGNYNVSLMVNCQGCMDTITKVITVLETGVSELVNEDNLGIYPNPFSQNLTFDFQLSTAADVHIQLVDVLGRNLIPVFKGQSLAGNFQHKWNVPANLAEGLYIARITVGEQIIQKKVVLRR